MKLLHDQHQPPNAPDSQGDTIVAADGAKDPRLDEAPAPPLSLALTVAEASAFLRLDPRTIREMVRTGELDGNQRGHAIRISRTAVLDWLRGKRRVPRSKG